VLSRRKAILLGAGRRLSREPMVVALVSMTSPARVRPPVSELVTTATTKRPSTVPAMLAL